MVLDFAFLEVVHVDMDSICGIRLEIWLGRRELSCTFSKHSGLGRLIMTSI